LLTNLMFSLNISLPLFLLIGLGFILRYKGLFSEDFVSRTSSLVYYVLLPAKLFSDVAATDIYAAFDGRYVAVTAAVCLGQFALSWILGLLLCRDPSEQGTFSHTCFRGNFAYLGLMLMQNLYGDQTAVLTAVMIVILIPAYNIEGAVIMSVSGNRGGVKLGSILKDIFTNPIVLAILLAIPFAALRIQLPFAMTKSLGYLGGCASTMALMVVGASVRPDTIKANLSLLLKSSAIKLVLIPALAGLAAAAAGLTKEQTVTLTVVSAMPTAVNTYIITDRMGGDGNLAAGTVVMSHLLSVFTITALVFLMKTMGML